MSFKHKCRGILAKIYHILYSPYKGVHKGKYVEIRHRCFFDRPSQVFIGDNSFVNRGCQFHLGYGQGSHSIRIGRNSFLGPNVSLICVSHEIADSNQRAGVNTYASIIVGDGVWIGANATVLSGVSIGNGAVVAAGAVVTKNIPSDELWGGTCKIY